jgi:hypothetical protein
MTDKFTIRSYRAGDEEQIAGIFNGSLAEFAGPFAVTAESWLAQCQPSWRGPGLKEDPEYVRVAERGGRVIGYTVTDHTNAEASFLQELCVAEEADAQAVAEALLDDAEAIARARGRCAVVLATAQEDGLARRAAGECGYEFGPGTSVFMVAVTNLEALLGELQPELERRLAKSELRAWQGELRISSGAQAAGLRIAGGRVEVGEGVDAAVSVEVSPERLPQLLLGQAAVGDCYVQDQLSVTAADRGEALRLLEALFPRAPMYMPRAQWW